MISLRGGGSGHSLSPQPQHWIRRPPEREETPQRRQPITTGGRVGGSPRAPFGRPRGRARRRRHSAAAARPPTPHSYSPLTQSEVPPGPTPVRAPSRRPASATSRRARAAGRGRRWSRSAACRPAPPRRPPARPLAQRRCCRRRGRPVRGAGGEGARRAARVREAAPLRLRPRPPPPPLLLLLPTTTSSPVPRCAEMSRDGPR